MPGVPLLRRVGLSLKILFVENLAVFQTLLVKDIALYREISQNIGRPLPELRRADGIHAVSYRNDGVKVAKFGVVGLAVGGSMCKFCTY